MSRETSERLAEGTRVALLTLALPRSAADKNGRFNVRQAQALSRTSGTRTLIVTIYPWWIRILHPLTGRRSAPDELEHDDVDVVACGGIFWYFHPVVLPLQNRWPRLVTRWMDLACGRRVIRVLEERGVDLVVAQAVLPWGDLAIRVKRRLIVPVFATEHDGRLLSSSRLAKSAPVLRALCERLDGILVVSATGAERMRSHGVPHVHYLPNGVDIEEVVAAITPRPADQEGRFVVLWAGTLRPEKGLHLLFQACCALAEDQAVTLIAVGGEGWAPPEENPAPEGLTLRVLPIIDQTELFAMMSWCDVFALPSWNEAWGLVYAEAMAVGRPVIMTSDCGMASEVVDGQEAMVVEPRNARAVEQALRDLATDDRLRADMGARGRSLARTLTWDHNARRLLQLAGRASLPT